MLKNIKFCNTEIHKSDLSRPVQVFPRAADNNTAFLNFSVPGTSHNATNTAAEDNVQNAYIRNAYTNSQTELSIIQNQLSCAEMSQQQSAQALARLLSNLARYSIGLGILGGAVQTSLYNGDSLQIKLEL